MAHLYPADSQELVRKYPSRATNYTQRRFSGIFCVFFNIGSSLNQCFRPSSYSSMRKISRYWLPLEDL